MKKKQSNVVTNLLLIVLALLALLFLDIWMRGFGMTNAAMINIKSDFNRAISGGGDLVK